MEWKVIFMSQVWQLAIVPSLRYCAARSWVQITTHTGGFGNLLGVNLWLFYLHCQFCPFSNVELG